VCSVEKRVFICSTFANYTWKKCSMFTVRAVLTINRLVKKNNELEVQYWTKHKTEICIVLG